MRQLYLHPNSPIKLEVNASGSGAGAVLLQEDHHGVDHPVCIYLKKKKICHQINYSTIEKDSTQLAVFGGREMLSTTPRTQSPL